MELENIKILRNRLSIPLTTAIGLLKKHHGDLSACEQDFHHENITKIAEATGCDEDTAAKSYKTFSFDVTKAINDIHARPVFIATKEKLTHEDKIGFVLWPEKVNGEVYRSVKRNDVFIPAGDFEYILQAFASVFPLPHPRHHRTEVAFDKCGHNFFDNKTGKLILGKIQDIHSDDPKIGLFLKEVKQWLRDQLEYADMIVVFGTL